MLEHSEISELHNKAMELASDAVRFDLVGNRQASEPLYREAYELERRAAVAVASLKDSEPSRSVLLRSAASLALDCREFREAERLISIALAGDPPTEICEELRDLLESVYFGRHLDLRGLELDPTEFQMTLVGSSVGFGVMESNQFLRRVQHLDRIIVRTAERKLGHSFREGGAPTRKSMSDFQVFLSVGRPASYAVTVKLGRPKSQRKLSFSEDDVEPASVIREVLDCLSDFADEKIVELKERIPDESYFNNFAELAKKLAPDGDKVRTVGFTSISGDQQKTVALRHAPSDIWKAKVDAGVTIEYVGRIRSADETSKLAKHPVFCVEDESGTTSPKIRVKPGVLQDIVKPYWGAKVKVVATKSNTGHAVMQEIIPMESE